MNLNRPFTHLALFLLIIAASATVRADGFLLSGTSYSILNFPGIHATEPLSINDSGNIAGTYIDSAGYHGFSDVGGVFTSIDYPGGGQTLVQGMNNRGQLVGTTTSNIGFVYSGGVFTPLANPSLDPFGINDQGQITGYYYDSAGVPHGFMLTGNTVTTIDAPNAGETFLFGINDSGQIVGQSVTINGPESGFLYSNGVFSTISCPGAYATLPFGINNNGAIVGICESPQGVQGFVDISGSFSILNVPFYNHTEAYSINDANQVVGRVAGNIQVPEPSTRLLLILGFLVWIVLLCKVRLRCPSRMPWPSP